MAKILEWRFDEEAWARIMEAAVSRGFTRHRPETIERIRRTKMANRKRKQRAAVERSIARRRKPARRTNLQERILGAMEPGAWYGARDVAELAGLDKKTQAAPWMVCRGIRAGLLRRTRNPVYRGNGDPWENMARKAAGEGFEPQWLYQLTDAGEKCRDTAARLRSA